MDSASMDWGPTYFILTLGCQEEGRTPYFTQAPSYPQFQESTGAPGTILHGCQDVPVDATYISSHVYMILIQSQHCPVQTILQKKGLSTFSSNY